MGTSGARACMHNGAWGCSHAYHIITIEKKKYCRGVSKHSDVASWLSINKKYGSTCRLMDAHRCTCWISDQVRWRLDLSLGGGGICVMYNTLPLWGGGSYFDTCCSPKPLFLHSIKRHDFCGPPHTIGQFFIRQRRNFPPLVNYYISMYNTLTERCFATCVSSFRSKALDKGETSCLQNCKSFPHFANECV